METNLLDDMVLKTEVSEEEVELLIDNIDHDV